MNQISVCLGLSVLAAGGTLSSLGALRESKPTDPAFYSEPGLLRGATNAALGNLYEPAARTKFAQPTTLNDRPNVILAKIQDRMTFALRPRPREPRN